MPTSKPRSQRRTVSLSRERLIHAAIAILDADGEDALTFRVLASRLATGSGAIYHYVANKDELLKAATADVIADGLKEVSSAADPLEDIRVLALEVFDAIDAHPWVGTQLSREPWQFAIVQIFEAVGTRLQALGVADEAQFDSASAIVNYILGLAGQYAAAARLHPRATDRTEFLQAIAAEWKRLGDEDFPFVHRMAGKLDGHEDRAQFLTGIDLILSGIQANG
ncbi:TetR/AcrR family transcriptional regulator [Kineococcus sp. R86509]|uniref:TetR/AcrR family transcriptional regulator n=1 Tax=Kineococcus sp. R86509 TaxID=3093851 RepID=UPI0036D40D9E